MTDMTANLILAELCC